MFPVPFTYVFAISGIKSSMLTVSSIVSILAAVLRKNHRTK